MQFFRQSLVNEINARHADIMNSGNIHRYSCYEYYGNYLKPEELKQTEIELYRLITSWLTHHMFYLPNQIHNRPVIQRAAKLKVQEMTKGFFPVAKYTSNPECGNTGTEQEPFWFSDYALPSYMRLSQADKFGVISSREISSFSKEFGFHFVVNFSSNYDGYTNCTPSSNPKAPVGQQSYLAKKKFKNK